MATTSKPSKKSVSTPVTGKKPAAATTTKSVAAKPAAKAASSVSPATPPTATRAAPKVKRTPALSPEQRRGYIEVAAYYIAERRGFSGGSEFDDWVQAEADIDRLLREGILKP